LNNFLKRALTGGAFVAVLLGCSYYPLSFSILFCIITILGTWEFYTLSEKADSKPQKLTGTLFAVLLFSSNSLVSNWYFDKGFLIINIPLLFLIFIFELYSKAQHPFRNIAFTLAGIIYVAIPFSLLNYIVMSTGIFSYQVLFGFFFILWSSDTGAYLSGSAFGRHKLFPRVSPGKTWEGSIGGAIAAYSVAFVISGWYTDINLMDWLVIATILVVIGTLGDLVESLFKRSINVKDSGSLLPGHGGILDRFDSLIMASPFVFTYLYLVKLF
jgi:phosphatidate cytidylyltransferase